jgi:hypothetical protein
MSERFLATDSHGLTRKEQDWARDLIFCTYEFWNLGKPGNEPTPTCTNPQIDTALPVASDPPNCTPWNERSTLCI